MNADDGLTAPYATMLTGTMPSRVLMPISCEFEGSVFVLHLVGTYTPAELRAAMGAALADSDRPRLSGLIVDLRFSESVATRTLGDITAIVGFLAYHAPSFANRIALVVPENSNDTLVLMGGADLQTGGVDARTFSDIVEARAWMTS
jgi:hypothetical protein